MGRFKNPGSSQLPDNEIGTAVFDVKYICNVTCAKFVFIPIAAEQLRKADISRVIRRRYAQSGIAIQISISPRINQIRLIQKF